MKGALSRYHKLNNVCDEFVGFSAAAAADTPTNLNHAVIDAICLVIKADNVAVQLEVTCNARSTPCTSVICTSIFQGLPVVALLKWKDLLRTSQLLRFVALFVPIE